MVACGVEDKNIWDDSNNSKKLDFKHMWDNLNNSKTIYIHV